LGSWEDVSVRVRVTATVRVRVRVRVRILGRTEGLDARQR